MWNKTQRSDLVSQADASMVPANDVPRSLFKMFWNHKKTGDAGLLYPFMVMEVLPGDHIKIRAEPFVRTATPLFPLMDSQRIDTHFFYVPLRLLWSNFQRFMGQQDNPGDSIDYTIPQITSTGNGFAVGSLGDHLGLPTVGQPAAQLSVSALPFRAYQKCFQDWFRDENLVGSASSSVMTGDGPVAEGNFAIRRRAKSHDYFTSALLAPQKFTSPVVNFPVTGIGIKDTTTGGTSLGVYDSALGAGQIYPEGIWGVEMAVKTLAGSGYTIPQVFSQASVSALRTAFLVQQYLEKDARGGTRYVERNFNHFRVRSPDARLQRSEFIGGGSTPLHFTPIAQTAPGTGSVVGNLGGAGTASGQHNASYASVEDGLIIGLISIKSQLSYSQGIPRMFSRRVRTDYYVPSLALLSEQAVLRKEIFASGVAVNDDTVFGYQEPFQELRTHYSEVTGLFRPYVTGNIAQWHLSQRFTVAPVLGQTFIEDTPDMSRVFAAGALANGQQYLFDININVEAVRPVPMFGVPAQLGRF